MEKQVIPQDILDNAYRIYPVKSFDTLLSKAIRNSYIQGRLDERAKGNCTDKDM